MVDQAQQPPGVGLGHRHRGRGQLGDVGALDGDAGLLQRPPHLAQVSGGGDDLVGAVAAVAHVLGPPVEGGQHHRLLLSGGDDQALLAEQVPHRSGLAQVAPSPGERGADVGGGPVAVVGEDLDV